MSNRSLVSYKMSLKEEEATCWGLLTRMNHGRRGVQAKSRAERYAWIAEVLREQGYTAFGKAAKGLVRSYIEKMTGLSRARTGRIIRIYQSGDEVNPSAHRRRRRRDPALSIACQMLVSTRSGFQG